MSDSFKESFVRRVCGFDLELERDGFFDEAFQTFVAFSEVLRCLGDVKCGDSGCLGHDGSIQETEK